MNTNHKGPRLLRSPTTAYHETKPRSLQGQG